MDGNNESYYDLIGCCTKDRKKVTKRQRKAETDKTIIINI